MANKRYYEPWFDADVKITTPPLVKQTGAAVVGGDAIVRQSKSRSKTWLIVALILVGLAVVIAAFLLGRGNGSPVDSVAFVVADFGNNTYQTGSGTIVSPDGYILTNHHVLHKEKTGAPALRLAVRLHSGTSQSTVVPAEVIAEGSEAKNYESLFNDWALLKIATSGSLSYLKIGQSRPSNLKPGDKLTALGFPKVTVDPRDTTGPTCDVAPGSVTSFLPNDSKPDCIVHICSTQSGSSGGPLINANGELVGIQTAVNEDANNSAKHLAIPIHMLESKVLDPYKIDHPK